MLYILYSFNFSISIANVNRMVKDWNTVFNLEKWNFVIILLKKELWILRLKDIKTQVIPSIILSFDRTYVCFDLRTVFKKYTVHSVYVNIFIWELRLCCGLFTPVRTCVPIMTSAEFTVYCLAILTTQDIHSVSSDYYDKNCGNLYFNKFYD